MSDADTTNPPGASTSPTWKRKWKHNPKNPTVILFWNDLENDERLKTCSWAARGLWSCKLLPIAARSAERGVIQIGGPPCRWNVELPVALAIDGGAGDPEVVKLLAASFLPLLTELASKGAASVDDRGRLYNRRMVREAEISKRRSEAGKLGANARNAGRQNGGKGGGKLDGKTVGKPQAGEGDLSPSSDGSIQDEADKVERQTSGNPNTRYEQRGCPIECGGGSAGSSSQLL